MNAKRWDIHRGRTALVTGGASGIGLEFARLLARAGWKLVLVGRNEEKLDAAQKSLNDEFGASVRTESCDLSDSGGAYELYDKFGGEDTDVFLLVNNAGFGLFGHTIRQSPEEISAMLSLNVTSLTLLSTLFGKAMAERGGGYILNVGSLAGRTPMPHFASYGASKRYVHDFSIALRHELAHRGVGVTCLEPGYVRTSFDANAHIENERYLRFSQRNSMHPQEVAAAGLRALFRGKARVVPGFSNSIIAALASVIPPSWSARVVYGAVSRLTS